MSQVNYLTRRKALFLLLFSAPLCLGATSEEEEFVRSYVPPPSKKEILSSATFINYTNDNFFDNLLEAALTRGDKVIDIKIREVFPDEMDNLEHLTTWIMAWSRGGTVEEVISDKSRPKNGSSIAASPLHASPAASPLVNITVNLVGVLNKLEDWFVSSRDWYTSQRTMEKRTELLKPYLMDWFEDEESGGTDILFYRTTIRT